VWRALAFSIACALGAAACSSTDLSVNGPSGTKCQVSVDSSPSTLPATGGSGILTVTTTRDCTWDATTAVPWLVLTGGAGGQGSGEVAYRANANADPSVRRASVTVNDTSVVIAQEAAPCRFTVTVASPTVEAAGGNVDVGVQSSSAACAWNVTSQVGWIHVDTTPQHGSHGTTLNVEPNTGIAREGTVSVAGETVRIAQQAVPVPTPGPAPAPTPEPTPPPSPTPTPTPDPTPPPPACTFTLAPASDRVTALGGVGSFRVTASDECRWTASSSAGWLTITSGNSGTGSGTVVWAAGVSSLVAARTATITVADQTFTLVQDALLPPACTFAISPTSATVSSDATTLSVDVTTQPGCNWTVKQVDKWLDVRSGSSGTGNGRVEVSVQRLKGSTRIGTITIAGQAFTVTQQRSSD
jgi:hypothetical protein